MSSVELRHLVVMSSTAIAVTTGASVTTAVGIATAQNASRWLAPSGWKTVDSSYSTPSIFTWFSPYRSLSPLLPCKTRRSSTTFCSGPPLRPCVPLRRTPSILARRSDSFRCSIPGARLFFTIRICIAWFRVAAFPRMARDGFPAGRSSSCLLPCWRVCFVDCSSTISSKPSMPATCSSFPPWNTSGARRLLASRRSHPENGLGRLREASLRGT